MTPKFNEAKKRARLKALSRNIWILCFTTSVIRNEHRYVQDLQ